MLHCDPASVPGALHVGAHLIFRATPCGRKPRLREIKRLVQGHIVNVWLTPNSQRGGGARTSHGGWGKGGRVELGQSSL